MPSTAARLVLASSLAVLAGAGATGSARAATVTPSDFFPGLPHYSVVMSDAVTTLEVDADPADPSRIRFRETGEALTLASSSASGPPCRQATDGSISCVKPFETFGTAGVTVTNEGGSATPPERDRVIVAGSAHGDPASTWLRSSISVSSPHALMELFGGENQMHFAGSDLSTGSPAAPADLLHTGAGGVGEPSPDVAEPLGAGDDRLDGGAGADRVDGGAGDDELDGGGGPDELLGGNDADVVSGDEGDDVLTGDAGNDVLTGGAGADRLDGGDGDDVLTGGAGPDQILGGTGDDRIDTRDGERDGVDCGLGTDVATVDELDATDGCETVDRSPVPATSTTTATTPVPTTTATSATTPVPTTTTTSATTPAVSTTEVAPLTAPLSLRVPPAPPAPRLRLGGHPTVTLLRRHGLRLTLSGAEVGVRVIATLRVGSRPLALTSAISPAAGTTRLHLRPTARALRGLRRGRLLRVAVRFTRADGTADTEAQSLRLR